MLKEQGCRSISMSDYKCAESFFVAVRSTDMLEKDGLKIACGKKQLLEVSAVSTEGKTAAVHSRRRISADTQAIKKAVFCTFKEPASGTRSRR
jgi:hypothetical protein